MSQDLRDYDLIRLDENDAEASNLSVTATVGPNSQTGKMRGAQITLDTPNGTAYARMTEEQLRDLIRVLESRVFVDGGFTATGIEAERLEVEPEGNVKRRYL